MLTLRQVGALAGGFLFMLVQGSLYVFGTMQPYIYTYLYYQGSTDLQISELSIIISIGSFILLLGVFCSNFKQLLFQNRLHGFITILGIAGSTFCVSFSKSLVLYIIFNGFINPFFTGYGYLVSLKNTYEHLPHRKGLCSGTCMMGFGMGALVFNSILVAVVNPDNVQQENNLFPQEIGERLPGALRILSAAYMGIGLLAIALTLKAPTKDIVDSMIQTSDESEQDQMKKLPHYSPTLIKHVVKHKALWLLAIMATGSSFGVFMAYNFKEYGNLYIKDDHFLSLLGSLGSVANGVFRIFVGILLDRFSFKKIMVVNMLLFMLCCGTVVWSVHQKATYFITMVLTNGIYGSFFSILPTQTIRIIGKIIGAKMYYLVFSGNCIGIITQYVFHTFLVKNFGESGYQYSFIAFGILQIISLILIVKTNFVFDAVEQKLLRERNEKRQESSPNQYNRDPSKDTLLVNDDSY